MATEATGNRIGNVVGAKTCAPIRMAYKYLRWMSTSAEQADQLFRSLVVDMKTSQDVRFQSKNVAIDILRKARRLHSSHVRVESDDFLPFGKSRIAASGNQNLDRLYLVRHQGPQSLETYCLVHVLRFSLEDAAEIQILPPRFLKQRLREQMVWILATLTSGR